MHPESGIFQPSFGLFYGDLMKIIDVKATPIYIPMKHPLRWSMGIEPGTTRTIVELITDEGVTGLGEAWGGAEIAHAIERAKPIFIGTDPLEVSRLAKRFSIYRLSSEQMTYSAQMKFVGSAIEVACWDIVGKVLGKRCGDLWGGIEKEWVEFAAYLFFRYETLEREGNLSDPQFVADYTLELIETCGFRDAKLKGGVLEPEREIETIQRMRETCGERLRRIRFDPNQAWSVETSINTLRKMEDYDIEFVEDPTWGIEGMGLVRKDVRIPLATNMCVVSFEQIPLAVRTRAIDIILGDLHFWGGPTALIQLAKICDTFNLGLSLHDDRQCGISTAAVVHLAAANSMFSHAADSHLPEHSGDIITEPWEFANGSLKVPDGAGLGVTLEREQLDRFHRLYLEHGDRDEFQDEQRKGWSPYLPLW